MTGEAIAEAGPVNDRADVGVEPSESAQTVDTAKPAAPKEARKSRAIKGNKKGKPAPEGAGPPAWLGPSLLVAGAVGLAAALLPKLVARLRAVKSKDARAAIVRELLLDPGADPKARLAPQHLAEATLALSDLIDVEGQSSESGVAAWGDSRGQPDAHAAVLQLLLRQGARSFAVTATEPLNYCLPDEVCRSLPNPAAPDCVTGGGSHAMAVAVASGLASGGLAPDEFGAVRLPAACCGLYALRPTRGVTPLEGVAHSAHTLCVVSLMANTPAQLIKLGTALQLPGGGLNSLEVCRVLVAEDLFAATGDEATAAQLLAVAKKGASQWGGLGQVATAELGGFLAQSVPQLQAFREGGAAADVLQASHAAAGTVWWYEAVATHCGWLPEAAAGFGPQLAERVAQASQISKERYEEARTVQREMYEALRIALANGTLLLLPTFAGPPPRHDRGNAALTTWMEHSMQLLALTTLTGLPQLVIPVRLPDGQLSSLSLVGTHKSDVRLLAAAGKLGPMLQAASQQLAEGAAAAAAPAAGAPAAATAAKKKGGSVKAAVNGGAGNGDAALQQAELAKAAGNAAFKAGDYEGAIREYSTAVALAPNVDVYYSNRAMAYLKVMQFQLAADDCTAALAISLNAKALLRRGTARLGLNDLDGAEKDFRQVLALEPNNRQAREELRGLEDMRSALGGGEDGPGLIYHGDVPPELVG